MVSILPRQPVFLGLTRSNTHFVHFLKTKDVANRDLLCHRAKQFKALFPSTTAEAFKLLILLCSLKIIRGVVDRKLLITRISLEISNKTGAYLTPVESAEK